MPTTLQLVRIVEQLKSDWNSKSYDITIGGDGKHNGGVSQSILPLEESSHFSIAHVVFSCWGEEACLLAADDYQNEIEFIYLSVKFPSICTTLTVMAHGHTITGWLEVVLVVRDTYLAEEIKFLL